MRRDRAYLRKRLQEEGQKFWKIFPRLRGRVMPTITYSDDTNWFEPEPVTGLGWEDRLGLVMRWRKSGVIAMKEAIDGKRLKAIWEYDWPNDKCPTTGGLEHGKIIDPGDQENYRYFWNLLHDLHGRYKYLGKWFEKLCQVGMEREAQWATFRLNPGDEYMRQESAVGNQQVRPAKMRSDR